jgi:putative PIN family toxin of toxin-antitoxin system
LSGEFALGVKCWRITKWAERGDSLDTNAYVSDAIHGGGATRAFTATLKARWKVFVCPTILTELERVIRTKFNRSQFFANATVQYLRDVLEVAEEPMTRHHVAGDRDDTAILRAAMTAGVDCLVTGDAKLLALSPIEGVRIITLAEYLHVLQAKSRLRPRLAPRSS